jgi:endonuclease YncB( thermonuclease family)
MPSPTYIYRATCQRVIDGDTFVGQIDLGFGAFIQIKVRIHGVNAPEHSAEGGPEATAFLHSLIDNKDLILQSYKDARSFERWVCDVWVGSQSVAQAIIDGGHGIPFMV